MTITYRLIKGETLTYAELDGNFAEIEDRLAKPDKARTGFIDLNDTATAITPIAVTNPATWYPLTNDAEGPQTLLDYAPEGITSIWNTSTNQFDFSELSVGDQVMLRVSFEVTTTQANQEVSLRMSMGIGHANTYTIGAGRFFFKTAGTYVERAYIPFYMGNSFTVENPAEIQVNSVDDCNVEVLGFYVGFLIRGEAT